MAQKSLSNIRKFILLLIPLFFGFVSPVYAVNVTLQWDPNSEPNLAGYRVFSREEGQSYDYTTPSLEVVWASCNINNLDENKTYYFVVRAFDTKGFESGDSNEVCFGAPTMPNNQPPIAILAEDYIEAGSGTTVTLDGSRSTDADNGIASYHWSQVDGPPVTLSDHNSEVVTFTAPGTDPYGSNLTFQLTLTDFGGIQSTAGCSVYITPEIVSVDEPVPDIKANGSDELVSITDGDTLSVIIELDPGSYQGVQADWWIVAHTPFGWNYYDAGTETWLPGFQVSYQGPLVEVSPPLEVLNTSDLSTGSHTFYFIVDDNRNGYLDEPLYDDSVEVNITPP